MSRTDRIEIRLSPAERQDWQQAADAEERSLSDWIRRSVNTSLRRESRASTHAETLRGAGFPAGTFGDMTFEREYPPPRDEAGIEYDPATGIEVIPPKHWPVSESVPQEDRETLLTKTVETEGVTRVTPIEQQLDDEDFAVLREDASPEPGGATADTPQGLRAGVHPADGRSSGSVRIGEPAEEVTRLGSPEAAGGSTRGEGLGPLGDGAGDTPPSPLLDFIATNSTEAKGTVADVLPLCKMSAFHVKGRYCKTCGEVTE